MSDPTLISLQEGKYSTEVETNDQQTENIPPKAQGQLSTVPCHKEATQLQQPWSFSPPPASQLREKSWGQEA
ncbi:hypothetical protein ACOMHN_010327 [Nucella lapillus]